MDMVAPKCPLQSPYVAYDASTHHFAIFKLSDLSISGMYVVPLVYFSSHLSFIQSSSSGDFTLVARKATVCCVSFLALVVANSNCATDW
jgi:hypothetical protein